MATIEAGTPAARRARRGAIATAETGVSTRPRARRRVETPRRAASSRSAAAAGPTPRRRIVWVFVLFTLAYVGLAGRLAYLQVVKHPSFSRQAAQLRGRTLRLPARRGVLLDRNGTLLVSNEPAADIVLDPNPWYANTNPAVGETPENKRERALSGLAALLSVPRSELDALARTSVQAPSGRFRTVSVRRQVPLNVAQAIEEATLPGVGVRETTRRQATNGALASHIVGFTDIDGAGLDGLEKTLDEDLAGEPGTLAGEFDPRGRLIPGTIESQAPARAGFDTVLTLNANLQHVVQEALGKAFTASQAESASAVVLDPKTGDILALANFPSYDVNQRKASRPGDRTNRAVCAPFEPGSTLKVVTIAAALEENKVAPDGRFYCPGARRIGRRTIHCAHGARHGNESVGDVIKNSCNIATAECAFRLGRRKLHEYEMRFGFGEKTKAGLPGESRGLLASPEKWSDIQLANIAFGQGISVTPLQLAAAYAAIANDGVWMRPRIALGRRDEATQRLVPAPPSPGRRVVSPGVARQMRAMLQAVIDDGTGKLAQLDGYTAGGKTGTAQVAENGRYGGKYVASFVGMAPMTDPQFVILVSLTAPKGGYYGGVVAGPVFKEIAEKALLARRTPRDKPDVDVDKERRGRGRRAEHDAFFDEV